MDPGTVCVTSPSSVPTAPADGPAPAPAEGSGLVDRLRQTIAGPAEHAELLRDLHRALPQAAERLAESVAQLPKAGTSFEGFRLVEELGRGAFGRVFLARQNDLAGRPVVLKVASDVFGESQTLAQLQHTNIVPVYSVHRCGALQAVCMPYLGATTLADLLRHLLERERLPNSGLALVSTLFNRKGHRTVLGLDSAVVKAERAEVQPPPRAEDSSPRMDRATPPILAMLEGLDYVRAVLWIASRIADGLAHAHEHGIVHRDLKPANILLADDGQPMLLDFGVAEDTKLGVAVTAALVGGTLPYMAPEHLDACLGGPSPVTAQSDLYSLGVMLFELLTARHPFANPRATTPDDIVRMIAERRGLVPGLRRYNPAVSPAVESIVRTCLHPDPGRRYASARQLQEDLQRHLQNLPLRHAPEPSFRERARKWVRRHPRLASSTSVAALAGALLLAGAGWSYHRGQRLAELEAVAALGRFRDEVRAAQLLLNVRAEDRRQLDEGIVRCWQALDQYQVFGERDWQGLPSVRHLPAAERERLRGELAELLLLLARATSLSAAPGSAGVPPAQDAGGTPALPKAVDEQLHTALRLNERAEALCPEEIQGPVLWAQRAELLGQLGRGEEARALREKAGQLLPRTARDRYLAAAEHAARGRYRQAVPLLQEAVQEDPQHYWAWFVLGHCHAQLAQHADAVACFNAAVAQQPEFPWAWFNRGLVYLRQQNYRRAAADFDRAVALRPELAEPYLNRALARQGLKDYAGAAADLSRVLELDPGCTRAWFLRARVHALAGDAAAARRDREEGLRQEPTDEPGWVARGLVRLPDDTAGALADFEKALSDNPRSLAALQNTAHVLGRTGRTEEAVRTLNRAVELYPDFVPSRAGRGVYLARLGRRSAALEDAREALLRDGSPSNLYQVAGIYALTSRQEPGDRAEAYRLLALALRQGFGLDLLDADADLDPVRAEPEFRRLVEAARSVSAGAAGPRAGE